LFADSGSCVPFENALRGLQLIETGACELAHGSRKLPDSEILKSQTWQRRLTARLFREVALPWMRLPAALTDTQCGFKVYRGEVARELFSACVTNGFMFDIEIIRRAQAKGYRIQEFPISWTCDRDSRLSLHRHLTHIWQELQLIRRILKE